MKKRIVVILFIQSIFLSGMGQVDSLIIESYTNEIYSWIFKNYIYKLQQPNLRNENTTITIRATPKYFKACDDNMVERIIMEYNRIQRETLEAFRGKIAAPLHFKNLNIPGFYIYIFNEPTFPSRYDLEEKFKNWNRKFIEFTPIGFNAEFDQAMLYFGYDDGSIGGGVLLIFELKRKKWKLISQIAVWGA